MGVASPTFIPIAGDTVFLVRWSGFAYRIPVLAFNFRNALANISREFRPVETGILARPVDGQSLGAGMGRDALAGARAAWSAWQVPGPGSWSSTRRPIPVRCVVVRCVVWVRGVRLVRGPGS